MTSKPKKQRALAVERIIREQNRHHEVMAEKNRQPIKAEKKHDKELIEAFTRAIKQTQTAQSELSKPLQKMIKSMEPGDEILLPYSQHFLSIEEARKIVIPNKIQTSPINCVITNEIEQEIHIHLRN